MEKTSKMADTQNPPSIQPTEAPKPAPKYKGHYQLHDAIQDSASLEDITALLSAHHNPTECKAAR